MVPISANFSLYRAGIENLRNIGHSRLARDPSRGTFPNIHKSLHLEGSQYEACSYVVWKYYVSYVVFEFNAQRLPFLQACLPSLQPAKLTKAIARVGEH
jgi:hypothetical protein